MSWVAIQVVLFVVLGVSLLSEPAAWLAWGEWPGAVLLMLGVMIGVSAVLAYQSINRTPLSPLPSPNPEHRLVARGVYAFIRHPIYSGILFAAFGLALFAGRPLSVLAAFFLLVFFSLKSRHEDRLLLDAYPEYRAYAAQTGRFLPGIDRLRD